MTFFERIKPLELPVDYTLIPRDERYIVRDQYVSQQKNMCYHCGYTLSLSPPEIIRMQKVDPGLYPPGFFDNPIHLHHDHNTDLTLGAVHAYCNAVLWEYHNE